MTDKVQKIREEIERLFNHVKDSNFESDSGAFYYLKDLLDFIDSMQEEPVSEDLEKAIRKYEQRLEKENPATEAYDFASAIRFGANWQKEQMMAKAVDIEVKVDAGGYPYIPQMELYDYDKDIPLAKKGDKYKVILIKE